MGNNFQPIPKRFMVRDKGLQKFYSGSEGKPYVFDIWSLMEFLNNSQRYPEQLEIIQSTNLFDKDDKEIFEGSILREGDDSLSVVQYDDDEGMFRTKSGRVLDDMSCGGDYFEVIGHILSNPELMEEK